MTLPLPTFASRARKVPTDQARPFLSHLDELRSRLLIVAGVFALSSAGAYFFVDRILEYLASLTGGFVFTRMTEAFMVRLKLSMLAGGLLAMPVALYEGWRFICDALGARSRRMLVWTLPASYGLFAAGAAFAWTLIVPAATRFLLSYGTDQLQPFLSVDDYVGFAGWLTLAFGILFQLPLGVLFLVGSGIVSTVDLAYYRRHVIVALVIVSAMATPGPDIVSQLAVFVPTYLLYEVSYWVSRLLYRRGSEG